MTSTFHGLELGKRALFAQQTALSTTSQNIANANTIGYTRQRAEMQATNAIPIPGMHSDTSPSQLGTGVEVNKLVRLREEYLDVQLRGENKNLGYWESKADSLTKIEELLNEPSDNGLAFTMDEFWKGWEELSKDPSSAAARAVVRQKGVAVAETFNYISDSLDQMQADINNVIITKVKDVNSLATQIGDLNNQISRIVPNNYQPNDLYDQRDVLIDQLSKLVDVTVTNAPNGMVNVSVGNEAMVAGRTVNTLTVDLTKTPADIVQIAGTSVNLGSGELLGHIESYGVIIPDIKSKIDALAKTFADTVNGVHKNGLNLIDIKNNSKTDVNFFTGATTDASGNPIITPKDLKVNQEIMDSLDKIAAANDETLGLNQSSTGNGKNAQDIADIKFTGISFGGATSTLDDYYRNIIGSLGIDSQQAQRMQGNSEVIVNQVENRRQSVSGVSLDEEMANMIKYQQAYNAAARMVTSMDECLDKVINGMGRVGL